MSEPAICVYDDHQGLVKLITDEEVQIEFDQEPNLSVGRIGTFTLQHKSAGTSEPFPLKGEVHWINHKDGKTIVDISIMELSLTGHIALKKLIQAYQKR